MDAEIDEAEGSDVETAPGSDTRQAVKTATRVKVDVTAEPYVAGQCTVSLVLTIQPVDGHPDGPLVVAGVSSHDQPPELATFRLNMLRLPPALLELLQAYQASLPQRGADKAADEARAEKKKAEAEAKRKAETEARRAKSRTTASKPGTARASTAKAATPAKPQASQPAGVSLATLF